MATVFPGSLDTFSTKVDGTSDVLAADTNNLQDAVSALQAKVGTNGSAVPTSIDKRLAVVELSASKAAGVDQTWQNMAASRADSVTYTNTTGRAISVSVGWNSGTSGAITLNLLVGGVVASSNQTVPPAGFNNVATVSAVVPNGATYSVTRSGGSTLNYWSELRS